MNQVGVKELKARATQIVGEVRLRRSRYTVTYRGKPVAVLVPIDDPYATASLPPVSPQSPWDELTRLGQKLAEGWPEGVSSADVLAEMRR